MSQTPIRTTVVGSYPFPGWLEFGSKNLNQFGAADVEEMIEDAVIAAPDRAWEFHLESMFWGEIQRSH